MLASKCKRFPFVPGDDGGNPQQELFREVERGTMSYSYDVWAQQALFTDTMAVKSGHVLRWVDSGTAQEYNFKLKHAAWRGVAGRVSFCAESDYTRDAPDLSVDTVAGRGYHWTQPADVFAKFRKSEVYMVRAEDARGKQLTSLICSCCKAWQPNQPWCNPPECLPLPNADAVCRTAGAVERAAAAGASWTADATFQNRTFIDGPLWATTPTCLPGGQVSAACSNFRGAVAGKPYSGKLVYSAHLTSASDASPVAGRVLCFGEKPSPQDFEPFRTESWNASHFSIHAAHSSVDSAEEDEGEEDAAVQPEVWQLSVKTQTVLNQSMLDASFKREVPITPRLAAAIAEVLGATNANKSSVEAAAAAGAQWCQPGLTAIEWPTFSQFSPLTAGTFPFNSTAPASHRCALPAEVDAVTVAKACSDPQCKTGASTTGRVTALNKRIFDLGLATLGFATLSDATGLSAINMFGVKPPRFGAGSPFTIPPFSPSRWSQLKADDWTAHVYTSSPAAVQTVYQTKPVPHTDRNGRPLSEFDNDRSFLPLALYDPQVSKALPFCLYLLCLALNLNPFGCTQLPCANTTGANVAKGQVCLPDGFNASLFSLANFTAVCPYSAYEMDMYMDGFAAAGLQVIREHPQVPIEVQKYRDHPNILGWYLEEEATGNYWNASDPTQQSEEKHFDAYVALTKEIKAIDPTYPVFMMDGSTDGATQLTPPTNAWWRRWNTYGDVSSHDQYPFDGRSLWLAELNGQFPGGNGGRLPQSVKTAVSDINASKPLWVCLQAFESAGWIMPTPRQLRGQIYAALIHGATGVFYFQFDSIMSRTGGNVGFGLSSLTAVHYGGKVVPGYDGPDAQQVASPSLLQEADTLWTAAASLNTELLSIKHLLFAKTSTLPYSLSIGGNCE